MFIYFYYFSIYIDCKFIYIILQYEIILFYYKKINFDKDRMDYASIALIIGQIIY